MNPTSLLTGLGAAITADPSLGGPSTGPCHGAPGAADLFLSLVAGMLDPHAPAADTEVAEAPAARPPAPLTAAEPAGADPDPAPDPEVETEPTVVALPMVVPPAVQAMVAAAVSTPAPVTATAQKTTPAEDSGEPTGSQPDARCRRCAARH